MSTGLPVLPRSQLGPVTVPRAKPRVCVLSQRGLTRLLSRCCGYEFEDVITAIDDAELIAPGHTRSSRMRLAMRNRLSRRTSLYATLPSGLRAEPSQPTYELFFVLVQFPWDLMCLDAVPRWRSRSGFSVCVIEELWVADIDRLGPQLKVLQKFDQVFCGCADTVPRLSEYLGRPVEHLPPGVDAIRFSPDPWVDRRFIDVCAIGRNSPETHAALLAHAHATGAFYLYDSFQPPRIARAPHEHRLLLANQIKHSRYFIARKAKFNRAFETAGQAEVGFRFFEGLAGGAVLLGDRFQGGDFDELLGWEDSVIQIGPGPTELLQTIAALDAQPARLQAIRRRNVRHMLRRHDWLYRWSAVLKSAGLERPPRMEGRQADLDALAALFDEGDARPRASRRDNAASP